MEAPSRTSSLPVIKLLCYKCGRNANTFIYKDRTYCLTHYLERRRLERQVGDDWVDLVELASG